MAKQYTKEISTSKTKSENQLNNPDIGPKKETIAFILNYSKSISIEESENLGKLYLILN